MPAQRRPITVGRQRIVFHTRANITPLPTRWHETADGRFLISTPELTMLDLIRRQELVGGVDRVSEVVAELAAHATADGLAAALDAGKRRPQRAATRRASGTERFHACGYDSRLARGSFAPDDTSGVGNFGSAREG